MYSLKILAPNPPLLTPISIFPQPLLFSGVATELPKFKMKLFQFLHGNPHTYTTSQTQLLYAGSLLNGVAGQWYRAHVDPTTLQLPPSYDLGLFFKELEEYRLPDDPMEGLGLLPHVGFRLTFGCTEYL